ncbi:MAG: hypothetical protein HQL50_01455 [Magnetococcales bacterium]|nr:hypothetical protein [Magnetococcales bacterium]
MKKGTGIILMGLILTQGIPLPSLAGSLSCAPCTIREGITWQPDTCQRPEPPKPVTGDTDEAKRQNILAFNSYAGQVKSYLDCMVNEAEADLNTLASNINGSLKQAQTDLLQEADRQKSLLVPQKP